MVKYCKFSYFAFAFLLILGASSSSFADYEAVSFCFNQTAGECAPGPPYACTFSNKFLDVLDGYEYDNTQKRTASQVDWNRFTDYSIWEDGDDNVSPSGTDWADAIHIAAHGDCYAPNPLPVGDGSACNYTASSYGWSEILMGDNNGDDMYGYSTCAVRTRVRQTILPFSPY